MSDRWLNLHQSRFLIIKKKFKEIPSRICNFTVKVKNCFKSQHRRNVNGTCNSEFHWLSISCTEIKGDDRQHT